MPPLTMFGRTNWWPLLLAAISWPVPTELAATTSCSSENAIWRNTQARTTDKKRDIQTIVSQSLCAKASPPPTPCNPAHTEELPCLVRTSQCIRTDAPLCVPCRPCSAGKPMCRADRAVCADAIRERPQKHAEARNRQQCLRAPAAAHTATKRRPAHGGLDTPLVASRALRAAAATPDVSAGHPCPCASVAPTRPATITPASPRADVTLTWMSADDDAIFAVPSQLGATRKKKLGGPSVPSS